ncbi:MAG: tetratricopeptide repeat protein, partial [Planctomycetes bacterium]|nr:tetratricopeptide repeat protein [Planctomycetota bacterium]
TYPYYCHYELGLCYKEQGEKDKAIDHCEKSLALNPDFQAAATLLEELKQ